MIIPIILISCAVAAELISRSLDDVLTPRQQLMLRLHLVYCRVCARFKRQVVMLHRLVRLKARLDGPESMCKLPNEKLPSVRSARQA